MQPAKSLDTQDGWDWLGECIRRSATTNQSAGRLFEVCKHGYDSGQFPDLPAIGVPPRRSRKKCYRTRARFECLLEAGWSILGVLRVPKRQF